MVLGVSSRRSRSAFRFLLQAIALLPAGIVIAWALRADEAWFDHHVLPNYCPCARSTLLWETVSRWGAVVAAIAWAALVRPKLVDWFGRPPSVAFLRGWVRVVAAVALALVVCDVYLRLKEPRRDLEHQADLPPMRLDDSGNYVPIPSRMKEVRVGTRTVRYEINAEGNRAASSVDAPDHDAPTLLFTGESVALGYGVDYSQSYAARVGHALGVQVVNLALTGIANDEAYVRLRDALPTYSRPVGLVTFVVPLQLERNVDDRRQHLVVHDGRLEIVPPSRSWWATSPLRKLVLYHSDAAIESARTIFLATDVLARTRKTRALFVMTNYGAACLPDESGTPRLERDLFSGLDLIHVRVDIPPDQRIGPPDGGHPNERGHELLADAIVRTLQAHPIARP